MKRRDWIRSTVGIAMAGLLSEPLIAQANKKLNVLFIAIDDLRDWTSGLEGYDGKVHTPNFERLAKLGVEFTNAHVASTVCCPSRTAVLTGLRPSTSGVYNNGQWWKPLMPERMTLPEYFRSQGYYAVGAGKIHHHTAGFNPPCQWDEFQRLVFNDDPWFRGVKLNYPWSKPEKLPKGFPFSKVAELPHEVDWGVIPGKVEKDYDDARSVDFAVEFLQRKMTKPFFLACGIFRPHLPWYVPQKYFDLYPLDSIQLPKLKEDDLDDVPTVGKKLAAARRSDFNKIKAADKYKQAVQAYLASVSFADAQLGRLLDALAKSKHKDNTVTVLWSDHGWHLGEKNHWHKMTLWEEATRIPFMFSAPGVAKNGARCDRPVDTMAIYPTLIELCGLKTPKKLDGVSIVPLLKNPNAKWDVPAISEYGRGNIAIRDQRWRYIRYHDGGEELYDHENDPNEWKNIVNDPQVAKVKKRLAGFVPETFAANAPAKGAYRFDYKTYSWEHKKSGKVTEGNVGGKLD